MTSPVRRFAVVRRSSPRELCALVRRSPVRLSRGELRTANTHHETATTERGEFAMLIDKARSALITDVGQPDYGRQWL